MYFAQPAAATLTPARRPKKLPSPRLAPLAYPPAHTPEVHRPAAYRPGIGTPETCSTSESTVVFNPPRVNPLDSAVFNQRLHQHITTTTLAVFLLAHLRQVSTRRGNRQILEGGGVLVARVHQKA